MLNHPFMGGLRHFAVRRHICLHKYLNSQYLKTGEKAMLDVLKCPKQICNAIQLLQSSVPPVPESLFPTPVIRGSKIEVKQKFKASVFTSQLPSALPTVFCSSKAYGQQLVDPTMAMPAPQVHSCFRQPQQDMVAAVKAGSEGLTSSSQTATQPVTLSGRRHSEQHNHGGHPHACAVLGTEDLELDEDTDDDMDENAFADIDAAVHAHQQRLHIENVARLDGCRVAKGSSVSEKYVQEGCVSVSQLKLGTQVRREQHHRLAAVFPHAVQTPGHSAIFQSNSNMSAGSPWTQKVSSVAAMSATCATAQPFALASPAPTFRPIAEPVASIRSPHSMGQAWAHAQPLSGGVFDRDMPWSHSLHAAHMKHFKCGQFRGCQEQVINAALSRRDVFVLMPTGGGKSRCYQLPAVLNEGVSIVVTPLVSLVKDQMAHLLEAGISAAAFIGSQSWEHQARTYDELRCPEPSIRLLFLTPEKIAKSTKAIDALNALHQKGQLKRLVVDEAHCVSAWASIWALHQKHRVTGNLVKEDFFTNMARTECVFRKIRTLRHLFPDVPIMALTATATPRVAADIQTQLLMRDSVLFSASFNRSNLTYAVLRKGKDVIKAMVARVMERHVYQHIGVGAGIVYCLSRADTEKVAKEMEKELREQLQKKNIRIGCKKLVDYYHANRTAEEREQVQQDWMKGNTIILAATVAFGMGIDKPNVRWVFHHSLPKSLEGYHQETGRAGRDGRNSDVVLYYSPADAAKSRSMLEESAHEGGRAGQEQLKHNLASLNAMIAYASDAATCRRVLLLRHFGEDFDPSRCKGTCDTCNNPNASKAQDCSILAQEVVQAFQELNNRDLAFDLQMAVQLIKEQEKQDKAKSKQQYSKDKVHSKIWGMHKAAESNSLARDSWPSSHVVDILWGAGGKLVKLMQHDRLKCFGLLKQSGLASKQEASQFIGHLVSQGVFQIVSERLEMKSGQSFAASRQSLALGGAVHDLLQGRLAIFFAFQTKASSRKEAIAALSLGKKTHDVTSGSASTLPATGVLPLKKASAGLARAIAPSSFNASAKSHLDADPISGSDSEGELKTRRAVPQRSMGKDVQEVPDERERGILFDMLDKLVDWLHLQQQDNLFPHWFRAEYARWHLNREARNDIAANGATTVDGLVACGVDANSASWLQPFVKATVDFASKLKDNSVMDDMLGGMLCSVWNHKGVETRRKTQAAEAERSSASGTVKSEHLVAANPMSEVLTGADDDCEILDVPLPQKKRIRGHSPGTLQAPQVRQQAQLQNHFERYNAGDGWRKRKSAEARRM